MDTEKANIFVWIGKSCTKDEKREAMNRGQAFLKSKNYPVWTKVQRVIDGGEPTAFKQYFESWKDASGDVGHVGQAKLIHVKIHDNGKLSAETLTEFDQEVFAAIVPIIYFELLQFQIVSLFEREGVNRLSESNRPKIFQWQPGVFVKKYFQLIFSIFLLIPKVAGRVRYFKIALKVS